MECKNIKTQKYLCKRLHSNLVTTAAFNTKVTEIENKIGDITNLATKAALNAKATETENKIPDTSFFSNTQEFDKRWKNKEVEKSLATKPEVKNALDLVDKNRKNNRKTSNVRFKLFSW